MSKFKDAFDSQDAFLFYKEPEYGFEIRLDHDSGVYTLICDDEHDSMGFESFRIGTLENLKALEKFFRRVTKAEMKVKKNEKEVSN